MPEAIVGKTRHPESESDSEPIDAVDALAWGVLSLGLAFMVQKTPAIAVMGLILTVVGAVMAGVVFVGYQRNGFHAAAGLAAKLFVVIASLMVSLGPKLTWIVGVGFVVEIVLLSFLLASVRSPWARRVVIYTADTLIGLVLLLVFLMPALIAIATVAVAKRAWGSIVPRLVQACLGFPLGVIVIVLMAADSPASG